MFFIPKYEYDNLVLCSEKTPFLFKIDLNEYDKKQKDPDFIKNGIDIDALPESIKISLINNENLICDNFKDKLSESVTHIHLLTYFSPKIVMRKYEYAVSNIFDIPSHLQNEDILIESSKVLHKIFNEDTPEAIKKDMVERFLSDDKKIMFESDNIRSKTYKYFLSNIRDKTTLSRVYDDHNVAKEWKILMTKNPLIKSPQKHKFVNNLIKEYFEDKEIGMGVDSLIKCAKETKLEQDVIDIIKSKNIEGKTLSQRNWLKAVFLSNGINKDTIKEIKNETNNNYFKFIADTVAMTSDNQAEELVNFIDEYLVMPKKYHTKPHDEVKQQARNIFNKINKIMNKMGNSLEYLGYLDVMRKRISATFGINIPKQKTINFPDRDFKSKMVMLDLVDEITREVGNIDVNTNIKTELVESLNVLQNEITKIIENKKEEINKLYEPEKEKAKATTKEKEIEER